MPLERLIVVVASSVHTGRCRYCERRIVWATTASTKTHPARTLPFDAPRPFPLSTTRNDETGVVFEHWPAAALHFASCRNKPVRRTPARALRARV